MVDAIIIMKCVLFTQLCIVITLVLTNFLKFPSDRIGIVSTDLSDVLNCYLISIPILMNDMESWQFVLLHLFFNLNINMFAYAPNEEIECAIMVHK